MPRLDSRLHGNDESVRSGHCALQVALEAGGIAQSRRFIGRFPGELGLLAAEVAVGRGLRVDRAQEVEHLHDAARAKVEVLLESTNRRVDVIREGFDLAIRVRFPPLDDSDLVIRKLADSPQRLVASPSVVQGYARPLVPADLSALPSLAWDPAKLEHEWRLDGREGAVSTIRHRPRFITENMVALRLAALRGVGVCQFPTFIVEEDLRHL